MTGTGSRPTLTDATAPLRSALVDAARREAESLVRSAVTEGDRALATASARAEELRTRARAEGEADGDALAAADRAAAARRARATVLAARTQAYDDLRVAAEEAVRVLLADPTARDSLARVLRARLGAEAVVEATGDGGLSAVTSDGRRVDGSVRALVGAVLPTLDLEAWWSP